MSLITQCPACATMFKVVPDQLRISDGWVRCGQCDEVFDANAQLQSKPLGADHIPVEEPAAVPLVKTVTPDSVPVRDAALPEVQAAPEVDSFFAGNPHVIPLSADPVLVAVADILPQDVSFVPDRDAGDVEDVISREVSRRPREKSHISNSEGTPQLSFMRTTRARSRWDHPLARMILAVLCLLLGALMLLQVVVQERDRLAAVEPSLKPWLESVCSLLVCKIAPFRQIESLVIDSSSFTKVRADAYRLNFTLKNTASMDLAMPALELTLTDLQDQAVVRRVIDSRDFAPKRGVLLPGAELTVSVPISVKLQASIERISGYRLVVFYP